MKEYHLIGVAFIFIALAGCQWLPEVGSVRLSESSVTMKVGGSKQLSATVEPSAAEYEGITWTSSDPSVVAVTNGTLSARKVGTAQITASAAGIASSPCQVTVDATHVTGISLSTYTVEITEGESFTINATVSPSDATDPTVIWGSDKTSVATVQNGKIVAIAPGTATISVKTTDGNKTATCTVTVKSKVVEVIGITLSQSVVSVKEEETLQLKATVKPSNATNQEVSWSSGDNGIATVASDGTVTGVIEGSTTITAKSADGKVTATCKVTVTAEYVDIPDPNFRKYIIENFDLNGNRKISLTEAKKVTHIKVSTTEIESLAGIEFFENLLSLDISNFTGSGKGSWQSDGTIIWENDEPSGKVTSLDLTKNQSLRYLNCSYNQLTNLDLSLNTSLTELNCGSNHLKQLVLSKNSEIKYLNCAFNLLKTLDVSHFVALTHLDCSSNGLTTLDVSRNITLSVLSCFYNRLTSLDLSKNKALVYLNCSSNRLTSLDLSKNTALEYLYCPSNQLTSLDVSKNKSLTTLDCSPMLTLKTLYVSSGQSIDGVTTNRSDSYVPEGTSIVTK